MLTALVVIAALVPLLDDPTRHARDALRAAGLGYVALHCVIGLLLALVCMVQRLDGRIGEGRESAWPVWRIWQDYTLATTLILVLLVTLQEALQ
ncbi:hypothetical protein V6L77_07030 [Pannonibacter sp. Pt2-lr]